MKTPQENIPEAKKKPELVLVKNHLTIIAHIFSSEFATAMRTEPISGQSSGAKTENTIRAKARVLHRLHETAQQTLNNPEHEAKEFTELQKAIKEAVQELTPEEIMKTVEKIRNKIGGKNSIIYRSK